MFARIDVRLTTRAPSNEISGWSERVLLVRVTAPPVDGAANAALQRVIATSLDIPLRAVQLVGGAKSRNKTIQLEGVTQDDVLRRLQDL
jgi:uncharacterized protein